MHFHTTLLCSLPLLAAVMASPYDLLQPSVVRRESNPLDNCDGSSYCDSVGNIQQMCEGAIKMYDVNGNYTRATARTHQHCTVIYRCSDKKEYASGISGSDINSTFYALDGKCSGCGSLRIPSKNTCTITSNFCLICEDKNTGPNL